MANINSYYLYQKFEKRGDQPWIPVFPSTYSVDGDGTMPLVVKQLNDPACVPTYRTTSGAPYCVNFDKYVDVTTEETFDGGVTWNFVSLTPTLVEADSEDCGYDVCDCDSFVFEGVEETSTAMKTYRLEIPSGQTAVTAATWNSSCGTVPQDFTHTDDSGFTEIVTDGQWAFDNNIIMFTASTNTTNSVREGYMTITYTVDGVSCEKRTHLVQAAGAQPKVILTLTGGTTVSKACDGNPLKYSDITSLVGNDFGSIRTAEVKDCVTSISVESGGGTFTNASGMTSVTLPSTLTAINSSSFWGCSSLSGVTLPNDLAYIGNDAFRGCSSLTSITIPDRVQTIGGLAFYECTSLTSVVIGTGFTGTTNPGHSFQYCSNLQSVTVRATTPPTIDTFFFDSTPIANGNGTIYVPSASVNAYKSATGWSTYADRIQPII